MKTTAAILTNINEPLEILELDTPTLKPGQVLVKIAYSGICGTQLLEMHGKKGEDKYLPHTLGHEGSGQVLEVGPDVSKVKPDDHVVLSWIKGSGTDVPSTTYKYKNQDINSGAISTFMTHAVVSENRLTSIPRNFPLNIAALLGCAVPTGAGIVFNSAKMNRQNSLAVFGTGGIGLSAILAASSLDPPLIIAVDKVDVKLEMAKRCGATHAINAQTQNVLEEISKITDHKGVDFSIESAGHPQTMQTAIKVVRIKGGLCILAGNLPAGEDITIDPMDFIKGKNIVGTWGGETKPDTDIPTYINQYTKGKLQLDTLSTHTWKLPQINDAIHALESGNVGRPLIEMVGKLT
jgi:S-(hydroxymethyl)glutathione dehydrogenase/alcohol dehydrogenase